jgi:broad specificity phosphatase PhoE
MKNVITIQHTQAVHHNNGMVGSWTDWELTALGKEQAENIGKKLSTELKGVSCKIYSSDLTRAKQTADPIAQYLAVAIDYREELRELNLGCACGKTRKWMHENEKPIHTSDDRPFPDAEPGRDVWDRLSVFCHEIMKSADENIILVSHGFTLGFWPSVWLNLGLDSLGKSEFVGVSGGVSFMRATDDGKRLVLRWNDTSYIK